MEEEREQSKRGLGELTLLRILDVLQDHSDETHPLSQENIVQFLKKDYGLTTNRKRVAEKIETLILADFRIVQVPRKGYYFAGSTTDAELHFLADSVITNRFITKDETKKLVRRIAAIAGVDFDKKIKHLVMLDEMDKVEESEFFHNIELIDQAKMHDKRISFTYYRYSTDLKMHRGKEHEVSPYQFIFHNQRYYLVAKDEKKGDMVYYRLDRIRELRVLSTDISDIHSVPGYKGGMPYRAISALPYLFSDAPKLILFRAEKALLEQLIDAFGRKNISIKVVNENKIEGSVYTSPLAISYWAKQSAPAFEVLSPKDIREKIRADLAAALEKYNS